MDLGSIPIGFVRFSIKINASPSQEDGQTLTDFVKTQYKTCKIKLLYVFLYFSVCKYLSLHVHRKGVCVYIVNVHVEFTCSALHASRTWHLINNHTSRH